MTRSKKKDPPLKAKKVSESAIEDHTYRVFANDLNSNDTVFGGLIMTILDRLAAVIAERHAGKTCVTASVDGFNFLSPAGKGDNLVCCGAINRSWNTSMEIGLKVLAENGKTQEKKHIVSAYFTFVALDEHNQPSNVPPITPLTSDEKRRYKEAEIRRNHRIEGRKRIKKSREDS